MDSCLLDVLQNIVGVGLENGDAVDVQTLILRHLMDLVRVADEDGGKEGAGQQLDGGLQPGEGTWQTASTGSRRTSARKSLL